MKTNTCKWSLYLSCLALTVASARSYSFSKEFHFSVGTAAYQVEGGWDADGKGPHIWDEYLHKQPNITVDGKNGDVASDAYHKIDEDVENLKNLGVSGYKFTISWARILPEGYSRNVNKAGVDYYNKLIDKLLENDIEPTVSLFHWDLPVPMHELGGFLNPIMQDYFADYAKLCFKFFGDRVKRWITFSEPNIFCRYSYETGEFPPMYSLHAVGNYRCGHTVLQAHSKAAEIYRTKFSQQRGKIGISLQATWFEPKTTADKKAANTLMEFFLGWFAHPIFTKEGNYPKVMIEQVDTISKQQNFAESRLPKFTHEEIRRLRGSADFINVRHFHTAYGIARKSCDISELSQVADACGDFAFDPSWPDTAISIMKVVPWGLRRVLNWVKDNYNNVEMNIENGVFTYANETINDEFRVDYYKKYLNATLDAVNEDKCNIYGYTFWMFMDGFEWPLGYTLRTGLYRVDFESPERTRTPKKSALVVTDIIKTGKVYL